MSFDTVTYQDLQYFVQEHSNYTLERIHPDNFLTQQPQPGSYINLVVVDVELRKKITAHLDNTGADRFSIIHNQSYAPSNNIALGCMIYPLSTVYPGAILERDIIVHSLTIIAHKCHIGVGTFISGGITIAGNTTIGNFTQIGIDSTIYDQVNIVDNTVIGATTVVRKDITEPGTYSSQVNNKLVKIS